MDADLDTLCITVHCMADDLLPAKARNHRRSVSDAQLITLAVAQAIMGIPSDGRFLAFARKRLRHLFPKDRGSTGGGHGCAEADHSDLRRALHGRSRQTVERSALADAAS